MTLRFTAAEAKPLAFPGHLERRQFVYDPEALGAVAPCNLTDTDFYGVALEKEQCIPGPLAQIETGKVYRLDPRKGDNR